MQGDKSREEFSAGAKSPTVVGQSPLNYLPLFTRPRPRLSERTSRRALTQLFTQRSGMKQINSRTQLTAI